MNRTRILHRLGRRLALAVLSGALGLATGCGDDVTENFFVPPDPPTPTDLARGEDPPGIDLRIRSLGGGTGAGGSFQVGDRVRVTFTLEKNDGSAWDIAELGRGRGLVSGPTFNYQRVIAEQRDLNTASVRNADGSYTYTFSDPVPDTYLAPYNDSPDFDAGDGELAGMPLLSGTYTVGIYFGFAYTVAGVPYEEIANETRDFLFGTAVDIAPRAAVGQENCNACHDELQAHGGQRRDVTLCLLCHTAGAEDRNDPMVAGGTPGVSIEFKVMIHKIHNGKHLPSVLGIATNPDGSRDYAATQRPYRLVGFNDTVHDYSEVGFPVWPSLSFPMPRDFGYSGLGPDEQAKDDEQRSGAVACHVCHGDPDGAGAIEAPADGLLAYNQPTRRACGSCHDDVEWDFPYISNLPPMPPQADDSACIQCHPVAGDSLAVTEGHTHPLVDPSFNPGLVVDLMDVAEAGPNDMDGALELGEKVALTFTITDDTGMEVDPMGIGALSAVFAGPTETMNLVTNASIPASALSGSQPYTVNLPQRVDLEYVGDSTGALDTFYTALAPHWATTTTTVQARTATAGGSSMLSAMSPAPANHVDVVDPADFERDDLIVLDDGTGSEEYLQIQYVEGNRLWFASPQQSDYKAGTQFTHAAGASVDEVSLTALTEGMGNDYTLDRATGTIQEESELGDGVALVVSYTTDFVMPPVYPLALNDSPVFDEVQGQWTGKSLADGTYRLSLWSDETLTLFLEGETNTYRSASSAVNRDVLVGGADTIEPYDRIASIDACNACHQDVSFHGGLRRGVESCIQCHATAGAEDRPRYRAANAPATDDVTVQFVQMLHKLHHGKELANASTYTVVGFGLGYPDNFSEQRYADVGFPAMPQGTKNCQTCHGADSTAWQLPSALDHPTEQTAPSRPWRLACGSCHDDTATQAHIEQQTVGGVETCTVCHGPGQEFGVADVHKKR